MPLFTSKPPEHDTRESSKNATSDHHLDPGEVYWR